MNKVLRWVLYVLLGLVALGVIAGIIFAIFGGLGYGHYYMMRPGFRMMQPYGFRSGFINPVGSIFGGLLGLGLLVLIIVGIVALVNAIIRPNRPAQVSSTAQQPTSVPAQAAMTEQQTPSTQAPATTRTCAHCGKPAQDDWKTCPYCGSPLT